MADMSIGTAMDRFTTVDDARGGWVVDDEAIRAASTRSLRSAARGLRITVTPPHDPYMVRQVQGAAAIEVSRRAEA